MAFRPPLRGPMLGQHRGVVVAMRWWRNPSRRVEFLESAPLLLLHSPTDRVVPFGQSVVIEALYRRVNAPVALKAIDAPNTHAFWNATCYFPETIKRANEFRRGSRDHRRSPVSLDRRALISSVVVAGAALATGQSSPAARRARAPTEGSGRGSSTSTIPF